MDSSVQFAPVPLQAVEEAIAQVAQEAIDSAAQAAYREICADIAAEVLAARQPGTMEVTVDEAPEVGLERAAETGHGDAMDAATLPLKRPCTECRLLRVRCDRVMPCSRCRRLGLECKQPPKVKRGRPSSAMKLARAQAQAQVQQQPSFAMKLAQAEAQVQQAQLAQVHQAQQARAGAQQMLAQVLALSNGQVPPGHPMAGMMPPGMPGQPWQTMPGHGAAPCTMQQQTAAGQPGPSGVQSDAVQPGILQPVSVAPCVAPDGQLANQAHMQAPQQVAAAAALAEAEAEGLTLTLSNRSNTGFSNVYFRAQSKPYEAEVKRDKKSVYLGTFDTAEQAALCVARWRQQQAATNQPTEVEVEGEVMEGKVVEDSDEKAAQQQQQQAQQAQLAQQQQQAQLAQQQQQAQLAQLAHMQAPQQVAAAAALAEAEAEGLTLTLSNRSNTGFSNVYFKAQSKPYEAEVRRDKKKSCLGTFDTAEQAALCVARWRQQQSAPNQPTVNVDAAEVEVEGEVVEGELAPQLQDSQWVHCELCSKWRRIDLGTAEYLLGSWCCEDNPDPAHNRCEHPQDPDAFAFDNSEVSYTVEALLAQRLHGGRRQFLVRWHGYEEEDDTWEDESNILDAELVRAFDKAVQARTGVDGKAGKKRRLPSAAALARAVDAGREAALAAMASGRSGKRAKIW